VPLEKYIYNETRYSMLKHSNPETAAELLKEAQHDVDQRWKQYEKLAAATNGSAPAKAEAEKEQPVSTAKGAGQ
jgi:pyruvate-ferredoxin/flavodoxin oxidoreductase